MQNPGQGINSRARAHITQPLSLDPAPQSQSVPIDVREAPSQVVPEASRSKGKAQKQGHSLRNAWLALIGLGLLLELLFLLAFPFFARVTPASDLQKQALLGLFPWLPRLYWTTYIPQAEQTLARWPLVNIGQPLGNANLLLLCLSLTLLCCVLAGMALSDLTREKLTFGQGRALFWLIASFSLVFSLTFLLAPSTATHEVMLYSGYGRLVTVHHLNPYLVHLSDFPGDLLAPFQPDGTLASFPVGPVWLDLCIPLSLIARESIANILVSYRILGLVAHLANCVLIWFVLSKFRARTRFGGTLLYAWNPLMLLFGIAEMHLDIVVIFAVLMGIFFLQRGSSPLGLVFLVLASLINLLCLLLLPIFLIVLLRDSKTMKLGWCLLWWLSLTVIVGLVVSLAYAPYWQFWGFSGLLSQLQQVFWSRTLINSLDAMILYIPVKLPAPILWLVEPQHWMIFPVVILTILLLFSLWMADSFALATRFTSWLLLAASVTMPIYWPWYLLLPVGLALVSGDRRTGQLALILSLGSLVSFYCWLWPVVWRGQALVTIGIPLLLWGWTVFFVSSWQVTSAPAREVEEQMQEQRERELLRSQQLHS